MRAPLYKTLDGLQAVAGVAGILSNAVIDLSTDPLPAGASSGPSLLALLKKHRLVSLLSGAEEAVALAPALRKVREENLPLVLHVAMDDPSDLLPLANQDLLLIGSSSTQEASDMAALTSVLASAAGIPVIHFFDRRWVGGGFAKIDAWDEDSLRKFASVPEQPGSPAEIFDRLCTRLRETTGRTYGAFEHPSADDAASASILPASEGVREGAVRVRLWRPFGARRFLEALPPSVKTLFVAKCLHADVLSALHQGIVEGWSWFTGLPPIHPLEPAAPDGDVSKDVFEALISTDAMPSEAEAAVRDLMEDLAGHSSSHFQSHTMTEKGKTTIHLRIGPNPILKRGPVLRPFLSISLNGPLLTAEAGGAPVRSIDFNDVARRSKLGDRIGPVITSCLLFLMDVEKWTGLSEKRAREIVSEAIQDRWGDFSQDIVEAHRHAMDLTRTELVSPHPAVALVASSGDEATEKHGHPSRRADLHSDYLGFHLRSPLIACVSEADKDDLRVSLASAPIGAVFFGPVSEEALDREAWKTFSALNRGDRSDGFKARPPLERQLDLVRAWKSSVEAPVIAGISAVTEKNWLAIAFALEQAGADALELFLRSPEEGGPEDPLRIVSLVSAAVRVPVGVRITPSLVGLRENADVLAQAGAKSLVLFQAPSGFVAHPDDLESREEELLSGPAVFRLALPALAGLVRNLPTPPLDLAGAGPVSASGDLFSALLSGAGAVYVAPEPENLRRLEELLKVWMEAKGFASVREISTFFSRDREQLSGVQSEARRGGS